MMARTWVEISKENVLHNLDHFFSLLSPVTRLMAVVKSNANGHGIKEICSIIVSAGRLADRLWFAVDSLDEALTVRTFVKNPVLVLGYVQNERLREAAEAEVRITVYNWETIEQLQRDALMYTKPLIVHVKVETGMARQGISEDEVVSYVRQLSYLPHVVVEGIYTHFATSDERNSEYVCTQLARYDRVRRLLEEDGISVPLRHVASTAATLLYPDTHRDLVRIGNGIFGLWPSVATQEVVAKINPSFSLRPVLTWKTIVVQVKKLTAGSPVGYGLSERVQRDSTIAVLPVGYWDGYDRGLSQKGVVLIGGKRCKVLGRVCNNMTMVDVTDVGSVRPQDEVVLLGTQGGESVTADFIADLLGTINYEVVTRINQQLPRVIV